MPKRLTAVERDTLRIRRRQWLRDNPELWCNWSCTAVGLENKALHVGLIALMKRDGVVANTTNWADVSLNEMILELRRESESPTEDIR